MKSIKVFVCFAGGILLAGAIIRFAIAAGDSQALALHEPLLGIPLRKAVLIAAWVELAAAAFCLFGRQTGLQLGLLALLSTAYVFYQMNLFKLHIHPQGTFLGSLTDPFQLARGLTGYVMQYLPFGLAAGTYAACVGNWFTIAGRAARQAEARGTADQRDAAAGLLKMLCPACGGHVKFAGQDLGRQIPCPHCQAAITLRKPENLKMSCFFCAGHIEFPAHAVGQKLRCPHCKRDITLKETAPA